MPPSPHLPAPPPLIKTHTQIQTTAVLGLGTLYLLTTPSQIHALSSFLSTHIPFLPSTPPVPHSILHHPILQQQQSLTGVVLMGIGSVYAMSLYREWWEYVYLSVVGRVVIAGVGLGSCVLWPGTLSVVLALVVANDGVSGLVTGWVLGWRRILGVGEEGAGKGRGE